MERRLIAVTLGDRYGVGPELVVRLRAAASLPDGLGVVIVGDRRVLAKGENSSGVSLSLPERETLASARSNGGWSFLHRPCDAAVEPLGRVSADAGREVLETLAFLVDAAHSGEVDGIVYAPLNKQSMRLAGHQAGDELEFFRARFADAGASGEINILNELWTSRVTSHLPLGEVARNITIQSVGRGVDLLHNALQIAGREAPRLAVAALNPHAGEGGAFGREEIEVIEPAIAAARARGIDVDGPYPSDTVFPRALAGGVDGVVTMFHDQGQIALKLIGLGQGITLLAGLPVPIASPGHGTAFDIAGTGKARVDGLTAALSLIGRMVGQ